MRHIFHEVYSSVDTDIREVGGAVGNQSQGWGVIMILI